MKEIIGKILEDSALAARYRALGKEDAEGFAQLARDAGFEVTAEQIAAEREKADGELSEEDLGQVAAGSREIFCSIRGHFG